LKLLVKEISRDEIKKEKRNLRNWKASGSNCILSRLIKHSRKNVYSFIFKICHRVWQEKKMPDNWNKAIILPLHKKGDETKFSN